MTQPATGGCLCGAIRYEVSAPLEKLITCYCTDCQRTSGTGASVNAPLPSSGFRIVHGATKVFSKPADSGTVLHRHFCGDCGSPIYSQRANMPEALVLKAGTLDRHSGLRLAMNIWTRSRQPWTPLDESLECFEMGRPVAR